MCLRGILAALRAGSIDYGSARDVSPFGRANLLRHPTVNGILPRTFGSSAGLFHVEQFDHLWL